MAQILASDVAGWLKKGKKCVYDAGRFRLLLLGSSQQLSSQQSAVYTREANLSNGQLGECKSGWEICRVGKMTV